MKPAAAESRRLRYGSWGFDTAGMDRTVEPGDDFYSFVNGTWSRNTQIPADRSSYGAFAVLRDLSEARVRKLVEGYSLGAAGDEGKIAALYQGFMDEAAAERLDAVPLLARMVPIYQAKSKDDIARLMGRALGGFGSTFFGPGVSDDAKRPDVYALYLRQAGLGLGDRDFYLDAKFKPQRDRYLDYVRQMLEMAGWPDAAELGPGRRRPRDEDRRGALDPRREPQPRQDLQSDDPRRARGAGPRLPLARPSSTPPASRAPSARSSPRTPPSPRSPGSSPTPTFRPSRPGRPSTPPTRCRPCCRSASSTPISSSAPSSSTASRSSASGGSAASPSPRMRSARRSGATMSKLYFPPESKAKMDALVVNLRTAMGSRIRGPAVDGPGDQGGGSEEARGLQRQDRLSRQVARLFGAAGRSRATSSAMPSAPPSSNGTIAATASTSRSTRPSGE